MLGATRTVGVELRVAGFATVDEAELRRKLGHGAWHVWQVLCARRDRQGMTNITIDAIANAPEFVAIHRRVVRKALARLRQAGLVEHVRAKWERKQDPHGVSFVARGVIRCVRGARQLSLAGAERCSVPEETRVWVKAAAGHGGKRVGTGRKKRVSRGAVTTFSRGAASESRGAVTDPNPAFQEGLHIKSLNTCSPSGLQKDSPYGESTPTPNASALSLQTSDVPGVGGVFGGGAKWTPPMVSTPMRGLPPYPGWSLVAPAQVPDPPKLKPTDPEDYKVRLLAHAFRGAVESVYGTRCFLLANLTAKSKSYRLLASAATALEQAEVAPVAWCAHAVRRWYLIRTHTNGWREGMPVPLPPIGVVFSAKSITEKLSDESYKASVESSAAGGRAIFGNTHKALLVRYQELRAAVARGETVSDAMAIFFPGSSYEDMVDAAKNEAIDTRNRLQHEISRGKFVW